MDIKFLMAFVFFAGCAVGALLLFIIDMILIEVESDDEKIFDFEQYIREIEGEQEVDDEQDM